MDRLAGPPPGLLLRHVLSIPFIYGLAVPLVLLDASVCLYQAVAFRLWGLERVSRREHLILDRHRLLYLNPVQRLNCHYCGYANGVLSFAREIAARTEQYWCPIKHETAPPAPHPRYPAFIDYGDDRELATRLEALRRELPPSRPRRRLADRLGAVAERIGPYPTQEG